MFFYLSKYFSGITGLMMHSLILAVMSFTGDSLILLGGNEDSMHKGSCLPRKKSCTSPPIWFDRVYKWLAIKDVARCIGFPTEWFLSTTSFPFFTMMCQLKNMVLFDNFEIWWTARRSSLVVVNNSIKRPSKSQSNKWFHITANINFSLCFMGRVPRRAWVKSLQRPCFGIVIVRADDMLSSQIKKCYCRSMGDGWLKSQWEIHEHLMLGLTFSITCNRPFIHFSSISFC